MRADFTLGVCFDNNDPNNLGRIRAIPISDVGNVTSLRDIKTYTNLQDTKALNNNLYQPWYTIKNNNFTERDPYLCEPFLPKNIGLLPNPGQLVKIIKYDKGGTVEFIGPYTIDQVTLTEEYRNVIRNLQKNVDISSVLPKKTKTFISGYNSEQFILGENEVLMRLDHINTDKSRKSTYPFIQLTQFNNSYTISNQTVTTTVNNDVAVNYIAQLYITYTPKLLSSTEQNVTGIIILYDASTLTNKQNKIGLTKNTYDPTNEYITMYTDNYIARHTIMASNMTDFTILVDNIIQSYKNDSKILYYNPSGSTSQTKNDVNKNQTIVTDNNLPNLPTSGGGTHDNPSVITGGLRNWIFRLAPNTGIKNYIGTFTAPNIADPTNVNVLNYNDYLKLDTLISAYKKDQNFGLLSETNQQIVTSNQDVPTDTGIPQSVHAVYADKFLFMSSLNTPSLVDDDSIDGIGSAQISEILYGTNKNTQTYGFLRGEPMMNLLNDIMAMLLVHGHEAGVDPRASIDGTSKTEINNIINRIKNEMGQNQNNVVINHNLRLN
jgi:hypothetical protein